MYSRFKAIDGFGEKELELIQNSTAAVVGLGATGSIIAEHLARHSLNLIVVDRDYLEEKDCYTSIYTKEQAENSMPKAEAASELLSQFTEIEAHVENLDSGNLQLLDSADIVLDGTDNLDTRFLLNEYSKKNGVPWIYTAAIAEKGYSMFLQEKCFSCIFDEVAAGSLETCETAGIMREASSIAASRTAWKAVRYLAGKEVEELFEMFPGENLEAESPGCEVCEDNTYEHLNSSRKAVSVCGENKYQIEEEIGDNAFQRLKSSGKVVAENEYLLRSSIDGKEFVLFRDGRAIIEAADRNSAEARFDRILGR